MRDEYQKMITSDGVYSLPQNLRPYMTQMKEIFRNREQSLDDSFDTVRPGQSYLPVVLEIFVHTGNVIVA